MAKIAVDFSTLNSCPMLKRNRYPGTLRFLLDEVIALIGNEGLERLFAQGARKSEDGGAFGLYLGSASILTNPVSFVHVYPDMITGHEFPN